MSSAREPSMEDILASIKRVIAEEKEIRSGTARGDAAPQPEPAPEPEPASQPGPAPQLDPASQAEPEPDHAPVPVARARAPLADPADTVHDIEESGDDDVLELGPAQAAPQPAAPLRSVPIEPAPAPAARVAAPAPAPTPTPTPAPAAVASEGLLSAEIAAGSRQQLAALQDLAASPPPRPSTGNPFEDVVREMLRPMLKAWLDEHLPEIVEAHVRREVSRITGRDL